MKTKSAVFQAATVSCVSVVALLSGCAATHNPPSVSGAPQQKVATSPAPNKVAYTPITGSRIQSRTTEKHVRATERDLADEPVRTQVSPIPRGNQ